MGVCISDIVCELATIKTSRDTKPTPYGPLVSLTLSFLVWSCLRFFVLLHQYILSFFLLPLKIPDLLPQLLNESWWESSGGMSPGGRTGVGLSAGGDADVVG